MRNGQLLLYHSKETCACVEIALKNLSKQRLCEWDAGQDEPRDREPLGESKGHVEGPGVFPSREGGWRGNSWMFWA